MATVGYRKGDGAEVTSWDLEVMWDEWLDEVYGDVEIGGLTYSTSIAMESVDPTAYRIGLSEHWDYLVEDGEYVETYEETDVYEEVDEDDDYELETADDED